MRRVAFWAVVAAVLLPLVGVVVAYVQDGSAAMCCIVGISTGFLAAVFFDHGYLAGRSAGGASGGFGWQDGPSGTSPGGHGHSPHGRHHHHGGFGGGHTGGGGAGSSWDPPAGGGGDHGGHGGHGGHHH